MFLMLGRAQVKFRGWLQVSPLAVTKDGWRMGARVLVQGSSCGEPADVLTPRAAPE